MTWRANVGQVGIHGRHCNAGDRRVHAVAKLLQRIPHELRLQRNHESLKLHLIIEPEASGQGAQSIAVSVSELLNLKEIKRIADVLKKQDPHPAKLLEATLNGKYASGRDKRIWTSKDST